MMEVYRCKGSQDVAICPLNRKTMKSGGVPCEVKVHAEYTCELLSCIFVRMPSNWEQVVISNVN